MCFSFAAALSAEVQLTTNLTWPVIGDFRFCHLPNGHCSMDVGGLPDYNPLNFNSFYIYLGHKYHLGTLLYAVPQEAFLF